MARTQLIVEHDGALIAQRSQWLEVVRGKSRTTVKDQEWRRPTTTDYAIPYLPARYVDVALARGKPTFGLATDREYGDQGSSTGNHGHPCAHNKVSDYHSVTVQICASTAPHRNAGVSGTKAISTSPRKAEKPAAQPLGLMLDCDPMYAIT
jgi:hypothetical protein